MSKFTEITVICDVPHDITPGVCAFCELDAAERRLREAEAEVKRLREANEHWHQRVTQLKNDAEAAERGREGK